MKLESIEGWLEKLSTQYNRFAASGSCAIHHVISLEAVKHRLSQPSQSRAATSNSWCGAHSKTKNNTHTGTHNAQLAAKIPVTLLLCETRSTEII